MELKNTDDIPENESPKTILDKIIECHCSGDPSEVPSRDYGTHLDIMREQFIKSCLSHDCKQCEFLTKETVDKIGIDKFISCYNEFLKKTFCVTLT